MATKNLSREEIIHLGKLADLKLSDKEIKKYQEQLAKTLDYVKNLNELDTTKVSTTQYNTSVKNINFEDGIKNEKGLTQEEALKNSSKSKKGYFFVKKIM